MKPGNVTGARGRQRDSVNGDGESETFEKSPPRKLGDREGREDGDTIRANCNGGKDIVGMRTRKGKDGKREMGEDGPFSFSFLESSAYIS